MNPCKHGHIDGALHAPCYQCRSEFYEENLEFLYLMKKHNDAVQEAMSREPLTITQEE